MKIVVRGTNWVGDAVMQIPALRELRRLFPDAHITLATRSWAQGIFEDADFIDEILPIEKSDSVLKQAKKWRSGKFDLALLLTNSFESALVAKLSAVKKRFGYANEGRSILLTDAVQIPKWKKTRHEIFYYLNLIAEIERSFFGVEQATAREPRFELNISTARQTKARDFLANHNLDLSKKTVAFVAGSTNSRAKRWPGQFYARLNDKLQSELNSNVILIGASDELEVSQEVSEKSFAKPLVLTGKTSLAEATAILSVCDLLISNDTGPAHISAALGTKTLVIFGPTNPLTTSPVNAEIIYQKVECAPCMLRDCPIDHRCMTGILPEEIFTRAAALLK